MGEKRWGIPEEKIPSLKEFLLSQGGVNVDPFYRLRRGATWDIEIDRVGRFTMFKRTLLWGFYSWEVSIWNDWTLSSSISDSIEKRSKHKGRWETKKEQEKVLTMSRDEFLHWETPPKEEYVTVVVVDYDDPYFVSNVFTERIDFPS